MPDTLRQSRRRWDIYCISNLGIFEKENNKKSAIHIALFLLLPFLLTYRISFTSTPGYFFGLKTKLLASTLGFISYLVMV